MTTPHESRDAQKKSPPAKAFERLVRQILQQQHFEVDSTESDMKADFVARREGRRFVVEAKYYRSPIAPSEYLRTAAGRLSNHARHAGMDACMLIVSSSVPRSMIAVILKVYGVVVVDRLALLAWASDASTYGELEELLEIDDEPLLAAPRSLEDPGLLKPRPISELPLDIAMPVGAVLAKRLANLPRGATAWSDFEKLSIEILRYLFDTSLHGWHEQKRTDDGLNRLDLICRIVSKLGFWGLLAEHLGSRYVLFEFKNSAAKVGQGDILTTEKYLLERALRRVGIVISREGASASATKMAQGAMREHGKLLLVLDDTAITKMLEQRDNGSDPSDELLDAADEFLLKLPR